MADKAVQVFVEVEIGELGGGEAFVMRRTYTGRNETLGEEILSESGRWEEFEGVVEDRFRLRVRRKRR